MDSRRDAPGASAHPKFRNDPFDQPRSAYAIRDLAPGVRRAMVHARRRLLDRRTPEGFWPAAPSSLSVRCEGETILLFAFFGIEDDPLVHQLANYLVTSQRNEGGWPDEEGDRADDPSVDVINYFALKIAGLEPSAGPMRRARRAILESGGADQIDTAARLFLAILGQIPYDACLHGPVDRNQSVDPFSTILSARPLRELPARYSIRELFVRRPDDWPDQCATGFPCSDDCQSNVRRLLWSIVEQRSLDYETDNAETDRQMQRLRSLIVVDAEKEIARYQLYHCAILETSRAIQSLRSAGLASDNLAVLTAIDWLLGRCKDHSVLRPFEIGGVSFAGRAHWLDDPEISAEVVISLLMICQEVSDVERPDVKAEDRSPAAGVLPPDLRLVGESRFATAADARRHVARLDKAVRLIDLVRSRLTNAELPHDFKTMVQVLTALGRLGLNMENESVARLVAAIRDLQRPNGAWDGFDHSSAVGATARVIVALAAVGVGADQEDRGFESAVQWLLAEGVSTESVSAGCQWRWMVRALIAAGRASHDTAVEGIERIVQLQSEADSTLRSTREDVEVLAVLGSWLVAVDEKVKEQHSPCLRILS